MKTTHTTRNNEPVYISAMETSHIINTIQLVIRRASGSCDPFQAAMHGVETYDEGEVARAAYEMIAPYVMELVVRGESAAVTEDLRKLVRRSDRIALPAPHSGVLEIDTADWD